MIIEKLDYGYSIYYVCEIRKDFITILYNVKEETIYYNIL